jgi:enterochelin esterase-like enzyme
MKHGLALMFLACGLCVGQPADDSKPASSNVPGAEYPRVHSDLRVTFHLKAPEAQKVQVQLGKRYDMERGEDGTWSVTIPPQVPGFHYYYLVVDGVQVNDPASESFYGVGRESSGIEIPESGVDYYDVKNVPHGEVRMRPYFSKITGEWRRCFVYTPPDYDSNGRARYPVLYLQHGSGENETGWVVQGRVNFVLDNLIAAGKAKPMIIVIDKGYATRPGQPGPSQMPPTAAGRVPPGAANNAFEDVLIQDVIPMIDSTYRTLADRDHRAMAGLSMGGNQTFRITLNHLDLFSYIAGFSGTGIGLSTEPFDPKTAFNGAFADAAAFNKKVHLVWIGLGTAEPVPFPASIKAFRDSLDKGGIKYVYYESPGTAHEWLTWRRDLNEFAPRLFR